VQNTRPVDFVVRFADGFVRLALLLPLKSPAIQN